MTYKFSLLKLHDELMNDKYHVLLSFSVNDNIARQIMIKFNQLNAKL